MVHVHPECLKCSACCRCDGSPEFGSVNGAQFHRARNILNRRTEAARRDQAATP